MASRRCSHKTLTVHDIPPGDTPTGEVMPTGPTEANIWDIDLWLPRGSHVQSGVVSGPTNGVTVTNEITLITSTVTPVDEPSHDTSVVYLVGPTVPGWAPAAATPGSYVQWNGTTWTLVAPPAETKIPATQGNQGDVWVDPRTGWIWVSEPDPNNMGAFQWRTSGSVKGPAGSIMVGMAGVVDFAITGQTGPLPQQQVADALSLHSFATNSGSADHAVLDLVLPRAPRVWSGAFAPGQPGFSLPIGTFNGVSGEIQAQALGHVHRLLDGQRVLVRARAAAQDGWLAGRAPDTAARSRSRGSCTRLPSRSLMLSRPSSLGSRLASSSSTTQRPATGRSTCPSPPRLGSGERLPSGTSVGLRDPPDPAFATVASGTPQARRRPLESLGPLSLAWPSDTAS